MENVIDNDSHRVCRGASCRARREQPRLPRVEAALGTADRPVALDVTTGQHIVVDGLSVEADGHGALSGTRGAPVLDLADGRVRVDGTLVVRTREAEVNAFTQALAVRRDVTGTVVEPARGPVSLVCLLLPAFRVRFSGTPRRVMAASEALSRATRKNRDKVR